MTVIQFAIINFGAMVTATGGIFLKRLSAQLNHELPIFTLATRIILNPDFWMGGICYVFPIFLWTYLLKEMDLTKLQPMLSVVYVYTILLSMAFLGEMPSVMRLFGISLIILGVIFVGRS